MERYHNTAGDPPKRYDESKSAQSDALADQVAAFLAQGGAIQEVGFKMLEKQPRDLVINAMTTPVYNEALAAAQPIKAKRCAKVPKPSKTEPPVAPEFDKAAYFGQLIGMLATAADQVFRFGRRMGVPDAELRREALRSGLILRERRHGSR